MKAPKGLSIVAKFELKVNPQGMPTHHVYSLLGLAPRGLPSGRVEGSTPECMARLGVRGVAGRCVALWWCPDAHSCDDHWDLGMKPHVHAGCLHSSPRSPTHPACADKDV
jgi:hypothetical protein